MYADELHNWGATVKSKKVSFEVIALSTLLLAGGATAAIAGQFKEFDAGPNGSTEPMSINSHGHIAGSFVDDNGWYGFIRQADGTILLFGLTGATNVYDVKINDRDEVSGSIIDSSNFAHGFVRKPDGTIIFLDAPGNQSTTVVDTNDKGTSVGFDGSDLNSFLRTDAGRWKTISMSGNKTMAAAINDKGMLAGSYYEDPLWQFFFGVDKDSLVSFDVPGSVGGGVDGLNSSGTIVGAWYDNQQEHGFIRTMDGTVTSFDAPGAVHDTFPMGMNETGIVTGWYDDSAFTQHGFIRKVDGTFAEFDAPGSLYGTVPQAINTKAVIVGYYVDDTAVHGFIRKP